MNLRLLSLSTAALLWAGAAHASLLELAGG